MELPYSLRAAIDDSLASLPSQRLAAASAALSQRYRANTTAKGETFLRTGEDVAAYAAFRLPGTFAAVHAALRQVQERLPAWRPQSLLDVGAGPGTAMWASATVWPGLERITLLEREDGMIALGRQLATRSPLRAVQEAAWQKTDITSAWTTAAHDLVTASYVLNELSPAAMTTLVRKLWEATGGTLVLIEPGTPAGFQRIKQARELLLAAGGKTIAPCPHDRPCPLAGDDWCHFSQRVARSRLHRQVKAGELAYEDEKFAFVAISRTVSGTVTAGRVIRHPQIRPGHIHVQLCTPEGLTNTVVTRKDKARFRMARDLEWGDVMPAVSEEGPEE